MIDSTYYDVLRGICERLKDSSVNWVVTASLSLALQGVPVEVHDIDIESDEAGAYEIERLFSESVFTKMCHKEADTIRSHFGQLMIDGIKVDVMGGVQYRRADGTWEEPTDWASHVQVIQVGGMQVPVLSLAYEYEGYQKLGRAEKVELLRWWLSREDGSAFDLSAT